MKRTAWKKEREKRFPTWTFPRSSSAFWSVCDLPVCRSPSWRIVRFVMKEEGSNWTGEIDSKRVDNVRNWRTVLEWDLREVWIETKNWNDRGIWRGGFEKFRNRIERSRGWPERWLKCVVGVCYEVCWNGVLGQFRLFGLVFRLFRLVAMRLKQRESCWTVLYKNRAFTLSNDEFEL